jgi:hypothetical protein
MDNVYKRNICTNVPHKVHKLIASVHSRRYPSSVMLIRMRLSASDVPVAVNRSTTSINSLYDLDVSTVQIQLYTSLFLSWNMYFSDFYHMCKQSNITERRGLWNYAISGYHSMFAFYCIVFTFYCIMYVLFYVCVLLYSVVYVLLYCVYFLLYYVRLILCLRFIVLCCLRFIVLCLLLIVLCTYYFMFAFYCIVLYYCIVLLYRFCLY